MTDHSTLKLGKKPAVHDPRRLLLADYLRPKPPLIPVEKNWGRRVKRWHPMENDKLNDCTVAAAGHLILEWTANAGKPIFIHNEKIIEAYRAVSGYVPGKPDTDDGAAELDVLKLWRRTGIGGHRIKAFVALEPENRHHVVAATYLFGGCYIGLELPNTAAKQAVWSVPPGGAKGDGAPGSWGLHAVSVVAYDEHGLTAVTWGELQRMTWGFWQVYCDEAYAVLSSDWIGKRKKAPSGIDWEGLEADLRRVAG